jgi:protein LSM14
MNGYPPMNPYMNSGNMYMQPPPQQQQPTPSAAAANTQKYWQPSYNEPEIDKAQLEKNTLDELKAELEESDALQPTINEAAIEQLAKKVSELNTSEDNVISTKPLDDQQHQTRRHNNNSNSNYRGRGGRYNNNSNKPKAEFSIPTSEFDFEASNAKFDKSEIVKKDNEEVDVEEEEIEIPQPDEFYDKVIIK